LRFLPSPPDKQIDVLLGFGDCLEAQTDRLTLKVEKALTPRVAHDLPGPTIQGPTLTNTKRIAETLHSETPQTTFGEVHRETAR
jgi:hypothetical protein